MGIRLDIAGGINTSQSPDQMTAGYPYLQNVRRILKTRTSARPPIGANLLGGTLPASVTSLVRMNDPYMGGPGYVLISGAAGKMYVGTTEVATGMTQVPNSYLPYRPSASPEPWCYVGNPSLSVTLENPSYAAYGAVAGMIKARSDGTTYKTGIMEPQTAPVVTVPSGSGPNWVTYRYVYRASKIGALSNPSPESAPQIVPQSSVQGSQNAASGSTVNPNVTLNATQYEGNSNQIRTKGGVNPGTLTDYIIIKNFGLSVPAGVTIDGVQVSINWLGQYAGTGIAANFALYYQGAILGEVKSPGIINQQTTTTATQGDGSDSWGSIITPTIANDTTFGFGVQILTQESGGSDRSFINSFTITVYYTNLSSTGTCTASLDPQVDTIDVYRQTPGLSNFTYVLSVPNSSPSFSDNLSDLTIASNPILQYDNFEPFPSIDLPRSGTCTVGATGAITQTGGDLFNIRWLPGTVVLIGGQAFQLYNRPSDTTHMLVYSVVTASTGFISFGYPATGSGVSWSIATPELANEPSPAIWGPTPDNAGSFYFGLDPNNPGDLLWSKGNNFDSAPDTNRLYVTSPSEMLMNGTVTAMLSTVFSTDRFWLIYPNFSDAVASVTGTLGPQWVLVQSASTRGLYMRYAIGALGNLVAFRAKDGIFISYGGGPEQSITDQIYNLFPHSGQVPASVVIGGNTIWPPDDTKPNAQTIAIIPDYIFYNYQDVNGTQRTLVYDMEAKGWSVDVYNPLVNYHSWAVGQINQTLVGCVDGTIRAFDSTASETSNAVIMTRSENLGSTRVVKRLSGVFLRAIAASAVTLAFYANRIQTAITGFSPSTAGTGSSETDYLTDFTSATNTDLKDLACQFTWPVGSGNVLSEWQPDWTTLPQTIIGWHTGLQAYGQRGWMHIEWMDFSYSSTATVNIVATLDTGQTFTISLPSTSGAQAKSFNLPPALKFKLVGWTANSTQPFTLFADSCECRIAVWGIGTLTVKPFSGAGFGVQDAST